jgi:hypothetical protein
LPPLASDYAGKVLAALFKLLDITDVDTAKCVQDVGGSEAAFRDFATDLSAKNFSMAVSDLSQGISGLSTAIDECGVQEVQHKLDALAASIKWANISTAGLDRAVTILVDASDLWKDIEALATAVQSHDTTAVGNAIGTLLSDWTAVSGGCKDSKPCEFVDGLLRVLQVVMVDVKPCEAALAPAYMNLTAGMTAFKKKDYKTAVLDTANGLDQLAKAISADACGLEKVGAVLLQVAPKLAAAIVKIEGDSVKILVGKADVYESLYMAATAYGNGDVAGFGVAVGALLTELRASGCTTKMCIVLEGLLASLQLEAQDFSKCTHDIDGAWDDLTVALQDFRAKKYVNGLQKLGNTMADLANAVNGCGATDLGKILEDMATKLGDAPLATAIGDAVQVLVAGSDITLFLQKMELDFATDSWPEFGHDLGDLAAWLNTKGCTSFVCKIVEGLLQEGDIVFTHLEACEKDLRTAESDFTAGAALFSKKQYADGLKYWASGLNAVSQSVTDCGLQQELAFLEQEANVLGLGNATAIGNIGKIVIHGADFYQELEATAQAFMAHDYRTAGKQLGKVMNDLSEWTKGHACQSDVCYVVTGIMQYMGDMQGDVHACEADFKQSWGNFSDGFSNLVNDTHGGIGHLVHFNSDKKHVRAGINDFGKALNLIAKGVSDCHLQELADLLEKLAVKLGLVPEVSFIEEVLHILIDGVKIEKEIGDACEDYAGRNWPGFGFNLAKLIETLLK